MDRKDCKAIALIYFAMLLALAACKKDKPVTPGNATPSSDTGNRKVYVVCEGNYQSGNASLSLYLPAKDSVYNNLFQSINKQPLGDVFQSMQRIGDNLFLCINNSDKIIAINRSNWQLTGTIKVSQPRYLLPISNTKAYVSSEYSNQVNIINPQTLTLTGSITLPAKNTETMLLYGSTAFICAWDTSCNTVYAVNTATDKVIQTITIAGYAPQEILLDKENKIWVLSGDQPEGKLAALTRFDPASGKIIQSYRFTSKDDPVRPVFNNTKDTLYYIDANTTGAANNNGIYRMSIHNSALPLNPFIQAQPYQYFWALGIDPATGNVYVGDPKGFIQQGSVYIYNTNGGKLKQFTVGLGPGHFYFDQ